MIKRNMLMDKPSRLSWVASILILLNYGGFLIVYPLIFSAVFKLENLPMSFNYVNLLVLILVTYLLAKPLFDESQQVSTFDFKLLKKAGKLYLWMMLVTIVGNLIIINLTQTSGSNNQEVVIDIVTQFPLYAILATLVMAPLVEEVIFRGIFYRRLRSMKRFVLPVFVSSFLFGFLHVVQSVFSGNLIDVVYIIVYSILGVFMVKIYEETANIKGAILLHFLNNLVGLVIIFVGLWIL